MTLAELLAPQRALRSRFDDFRRALDRRDRVAYELGLREFENALRHWTEVEERVLLPALARAGVPGRDPRRELKLQYVQLRELTRAILDQVGKNGALRDILGLVENLERRWNAHDTEMNRVYYPAAQPVLTDAECRALAEAAPSP
jgi:Hemerythrin HHE cation binding domain